MLGALANPFRAAILWGLSLGDAVAGLPPLVATGIAAARAPGGLKANAATLATADQQRRIFAALRVFAPNLGLKRKLVASYENTGTAIVTRHADVMEVLLDDAAFEVVYGTRMRQLTDGENFFLGMQPGWDYTRDTSAMHLAARGPDVAELVAPRAAKLAGSIVDESGGRLDLPEALTRQVPWDMTAGYFGVGGPDAATMQDWTTTLFWYLFGDLGADPALEARAMKAAAGLRAYLDGAIAARKAAPTETPDLLNRCLALQAAGTPGMSDLGIRNNLLGLLIGAIPTISKACCLALDEILNRPEAVRMARAAARTGDEARLAACIWEALRFNPHNPVIYRRATRDSVIARGTLREMQISKGTMVFAATFSATFDRAHLPEPLAFKVDRPFDANVIWGVGMHTCFGAQINRTIIPAILRPVLAAPNLRRATGAAGRIDTGGTPFPKHFIVTFDPG